ncbi:MAG: diadenylate cyclase CdaA [Streptococcaceae bacterium]|jgi:diadenylate cyclase|nr:diadenylate cyclase CdaA [Streptococcaceae bacterium]
MNNLTDMFNPAFWQQLIAQNSNPWHLFVSVLDIAIVAVIIYRLARFVQGTRLMILVRGVLLFIVLDLLAGLIGLPTLKWLLNQVIIYGVVALIIIFQPEIRQALERLGHTTNLIGNMRNKEEGETNAQISAYEKSFDYMSKRKIGALIAIERSQTLEEYAATGIKLDAIISSELIINIFIPNTPLHDGAVIVQGDKIAVTSAYLPLTERANISKKFGTRHRAAIGLSEVSDALVLVVSEETGGISVANQGVLYSDLSAERFHHILTEHLSNTSEEHTGSLANLTSFFVKHNKEHVKKGEKK